MTVGGTENELPTNDQLNPHQLTDADVSQDQGNNGNNSGGHPAWQSILDQVPDSLHPIIRPELEKWDKGVQDKFSSIHSKYDPYKPFIENGVDPQLLERAVYLVNQLETDPETVVSQMIEAFELGYVPKPDATVSNDLGVGSSYEDDEVLSDPRFKAMQEAVDKLQSRFEQEDQTKQQQEQQSAFEQTLTNLETQHGSFDKIYVTALMSQGVDGAEAVKQYHNTVNQAAARLANPQQQQTPPPVVMGGDGTTGSGLAQQNVKMGDLKSGDLNSLVVDLLKAQNT